MEPIGLIVAPDMPLSVWGLLDLTVILQISCFLASAIRNLVLHAMHSPMRRKLEPVQLQALQRCMPRVSS